MTATPTIGSSMKMYSKLLPTLLLLILVVAFVVCAGALVTTFSPKAAAAEIPRESTAVYVCEQSVTYYGFKSKQKARQIFASTTTSLIKVTQKASVFHVEGWAQGQISRFMAADVTKPIDSPPIRISEEFSLTEGRLSLTPLKGVLFFLPTAPEMYFDHFFLPFFDMAEQKFSKDRAVVALQSPAAVAPRFSGLWLPNVSTSENGQRRVSGPYRFTSTNDTYNISGHLEHVVSLAPLRFIRSSGDAMIVIKQPEKIFFYDIKIPKPPNDFRVSQSAIDFVRQFENVKGVYRHRMLLRDSPAAETIDVSDELNQKMPK